MDTAGTQQIMMSPDWKKKLAIIERKHEFPGTLREVIEASKGDAPYFFLRKIEKKLIDLFRENYDAKFIGKTKGLNCDRDTEDEVETAIRFFPNVLSKKDQCGYYPIYWLLKNVYGIYNVKAAFFIPLFAKLGVEFGQFKDSERGGLIITNSGNVLRELVTASYNKRNDKDGQQQLVDESYLAVIKRLRQIGLLRKKDISEYDLIWKLCQQRTSFPEQRFRYLANWDPNCLTMSGGYLERLPLHYATSYCTEIRGFRAVLEVGVGHFPIEMGFLFRKDKYGETPFWMACYKYGKGVVKKIVDDIILNSRIRTNYTDTVDALLYAGTEERVDLDGVYILLRREPSVLQAAGSKMMRSDKASHRKRKYEYDENENENKKKEIARMIKATTVCIDMHRMYCGRCKRCWDEMNGEDDDPYDS